MQEKLLNEILCAVKENKVEIHNLREEMNCKFEQVNARVDKIETKVDKVNARVDKIETKVDKINARLDKIETKVDKINARVDKIEITVDKINARVNEVETKVDDVAIEIYDELDRRFSQFSKDISIEIRSMGEIICKKIEEEHKKTIQEVRDEINPELERNRREHEIYEEQIDDLKETSRYLEKKLA